MFVSVVITFYSFALSAAKVPLVRALEFRCCREIPLVNQKLTFYERMSCITRYDDCSPRSHRAVLLQVAPFLRDCKGRGYRCDRRAGQTERKKSEFLVVWFKLNSNRDSNREKLLYFKCSIAVWPIPLKGNNWHHYYKWIFRTHRLSHSTWIRYHLIH